MELGELKPIAAVLVLPPGGPLLLAAAGLVLVRRNRPAGLALAWAATLALWLLSCYGVAAALSPRALPQVRPIDGPGLASAQAVVVLGGGVHPYVPEYGRAELGWGSYARLRYGAHLARRGGKPLAFAGGQGWVNTGTATPPEAHVARRTLQEEFGLPLRWMDDRSRDTRENAQELARLMRPDGIRRVAVVTDSWHMPRAEHYFREAGFEVVPAPIGFPAPPEHTVFDWLPSTGGLDLSRRVIREWLGRQVARFTADLR